MGVILLQKELVAMSVEFYFYLALLIICVIGFTTQVIVDRYREKRNENK